MIGRRSAWGSRYFEVKLFVDNQIVKLKWDYLTSNSYILNDFILRLFYFICELFELLSENSEQIKWFRLKKCFFEVRGIKSNQMKPNFISRPKRSAKAKIFLNNRWQFLIPPHSQKKHPLQFQSCSSKIRNAFLVRTIYFTKMYQM